MPPEPPPLPAPGGPGRRAVLRAGLLAGGVALLPGCALLGADGRPRQAARHPSAEALVVAGALADEEALLAAYAAVQARHPDLSARLAGVRADHEEHRRVLAASLAGLDPQGRSGPSTTPAPGVGAPASPATPTGFPPPDEAGPGDDVPDEPTAALAALRALERGAASDRTAEAVAAPAAWAPLLGVLAASEAAHAAALAP